MQKTYFHNNKSLNENKDKKKLIQTPNVEIKSIVEKNKASFAFPSTSIYVEKNG